MDLIAHLQRYVAPNVFTPRAVYDGRKNLFSSTTLQFPTGTDEAEVSGQCPEPESSYKLLIQFNVSLMDTRSEDQKATDTRGPKTYKIKLRKVAEINPELVKHDFIALSRF